jgi:aspartate/methionine/tyrosine aminotransferase
MGIERSPVQDTLRRQSEQSYSQWIRRAVANVRARGGTELSLFGSSVPEPVELVRQTIVEGLSPSLTSRYTSAFANGNPFLVDRIAARYQVPPGQILCTTGATGALALLYRALTEFGDHVLVETPGFDLFADIAQSQGLQVGEFKRPEPDFRLDPDEVVRRLRADTRVVVLSNLHNPSGMPADTEALKVLAEFAETRRFWVVVDEVYGDYASPEARPFAAMQISPRFISISSLTKIYGLHTVRCGWVAAAPEAMAMARQVADRLEFGVSNLAHAVAALVLEKSEVFDRYTRGILDEARPAIEQAYASWSREGLIEGVLPEFGCISFPRLTGIGDTAVFSDWLAATFGLIVAPGEYFNMPGRIRIGHGQPIQDLAPALELLSEGLRTYPDAARRKAAGR